VCSSDLHLRDDDGADVRAIELGPADLAALVFTDALFDALAATEPAAARGQAALDAAVAGHDDWTYDAGTGALALTKGVLPWRTLRAEVLGSYAHESATFLWGWANGHLDPRSVRAVTALRDAARASQGLGALVRPSLPCEEGFALRLARLAAARVGATGIYRASYGPGVLAFAVFLATEPASTA
jgi:hypothetical protein